MTLFKCSSHKHNKQKLVRCLTAKQLYFRSTGAHTREAERAGKTSCADAITRDDARRKNDMLHGHHRDLKWRWSNTKKKKTKKNKKVCEQQGRIRNNKSFPLGCTMESSSSARVRRGGYSLSEKPRARVSSAQSSWILKVCSSKQTRRGGCPKAGTAQSVLP